MDPIPLPGPASATARLLSLPLSARRQGGRAPSAGRLVKPEATFEVACRPYTWNVYGIYMAFHPPGQEPGVAAPGRRPGRGQAVPMGLEASIAQEAARLAGQLKPHLGQARLWLRTTHVKMASAGFLHRLLDGLDSRGLDPRTLGVELDLQLLGGDPAQARRSIAAVRASGLGAALAEVEPEDLAALGLGRGEVEGLRTRRPPECEVSGTSHEPVAPQWIESAHASGIAVVAAGVHSRQAAAMLGHAGIAAVSGPLVCRPMTFTQLESFLGKPDAGQGRMRADSI